MVEEHGAHIVEMAVQREQHLARLVVPHLDLVVVATTHKQRLRGVERDATHRPLMVLEALVDRTRLVVPQLDRAIVQRRRKQRELGVERNALYPIRLGLKLCTSAWEALDEFHHVSENDGEGSASVYTITFGASGEISGKATRQLQGPESEIQ